jgi:hypothetical protein
MTRALVFFGDFVYYYLQYPTLQYSVSEDNIEFTTSTNTGFWQHFARLIDTQKSGAARRPLFPNACLPAGLMIYSYIVYWRENQQKILVFEKILQLQ